MRGEVNSLSDRSKARWARAALYRLIFDIVWKGGQGSWVALAVEGGSGFISLVSFSSTS